MDPRSPTPAETRAAAEAAARTRLDQGKQSLEALKARELEEAEALALARIRIQTDQMLAKQAEALRDAERKTELVAIERRTADLDAAKEAKRKAELEAEAKAATEAKRLALESSEAAAREKISALALLAEKRAEQRQALVSMKSASRTDRSLRWQARWLSFKLASPFKLAPAMLVIGALLGAVAGYLKAPKAPAGNGAASGLISSPITAVEDAPMYAPTGAPLSLRLERELRQ